MDDALDAALCAAQLQGLLDRPAPPAHLQVAAALAGPAELRAAVGSSTVTTAIPRLDLRSAVRALQVWILTAQQAKQVWDADRRPVVRNALVELGLVDTADASAHIHSTCNVPAGCPVHVLAHLVQANGWPAGGLALVLLGNQILDRVVVDGTPAQVVQTYEARGHLDSSAVGGLARRTDARLVLGAVDHIDVRGPAPHAQLLTRDFGPNLTRRVLTKSRTGELRPTVVVELLARATGSAEQLDAALRAFYQLVDGRGPDTAWSDLLEAAAHVATSGPAAPAA